MAPCPQRKTFFMFQWVGMNFVTIFIVGSLLSTSTTTTTAVTTNCINKTTPSSACCSGQIELDPTMTSIGDFAFSYCSITGFLTIPDSVTSIGESAFSGCSGLTGSLTIPDSVTSIGGSAFIDCSGLTGSLTIPDSVTSIGVNAFFGCSGLTGSLTIPDSVTSIGGSAFYKCTGLASITLYYSTYVGNGAFQSDVMPTYIGMCDACSTGQICACKKTSYSSLYATKYCSETACADCSLYPMACGHSNDECYGISSENYKRPSPPDETVGFCSYSYLRVPEGISLIILAVMLLLAVLLIYLWNSRTLHLENRMIFTSYYLLMPAVLDVGSDIAYALDTMFYSPLILGGVGFFLIAPMGHFAHRLLSQGAEVYFPFCKPPACVYPFNFPRRDLSTPLKFIVWIGNWCLAIVKFLPWLFINGTPLVFLLGSFLFSTSLIHHKVPHDWWFRLWTGTDEHNLPTWIELDKFNESRFVNVLIESLPQLTLIIVNQTYTKTWTLTAIVSSVFSGGILFNCIWYYSHHTCIRRKPTGTVPVIIPFIGQLLVENGEILILEEPLAPISEAEISSPLDQRKSEIEFKQQKRTSGAYQPRVTPASTTATTVTTLMVMKKIRELMKTNVQLSDNSAFSEQLLLLARKGNNELLLSFEASLSTAVDSNGNCESIFDTAFFLANAQSICYEELRTGTIGNQYTIKAEATQQDDDGEAKGENIA